MKKKETKVLRNYKLFYEELQPKGNQRRLKRPTQD